MTSKELADLMAEGDRLGINVDGLLFLIEDVAWKMVNHIIVGRECTLEDNERAAALHTAAQLARRDFQKIQEAVAEGAHFVKGRAANE